MKRNNIRVWGTRVACKVKCDCGTLFRSNVSRHYARVLIRQHQCPKAAA